MNLSKPKEASSSLCLPLADHAGISEWPWMESVIIPDYSGHTDWPRISIITPSFNQADYIETTIRSVLLQGYPNLEFIIIDGGSTDGSVELIEKYEQWISFWISEKDNGQAEALVKGFQRATGDLFAWINSDDFYTPGALKKIAERYILERYQFICGSSRMIDESGKIIQKLFTPIISFKSLIRYWKPHFCPPQPSIFFSKQAYLALGGLRSNLMYAMDFDLWLRASQRYEFVVIRDQLSFYRVHEGSKTGSAMGLQKFVPEWRSVIKKGMQDQSLLLKLEYSIDRLSVVVMRRIKCFLRSLRDF